MNLPFSRERWLSSFPRARSPVGSPTVADPYVHVRRQAGQLESLVWYKCLPVTLSVVQPRFHAQLEILDNFGFTRGQL